MGVNLPVGLGAGLLGRGNKPVAVIVVPDDIVALIAAVQNVVDGSGYSRRNWRGMADG